MKLINKLFVLSYFFLLSFSLLSQNTEKDLAEQYFLNKEYDKAIIYFNQLYKKTRNSYYYDKLLICYKEIKDYNNAFKLIKKQMKYFPENPVYNIDFAYFKELEGDKQTAEKYYLKTLKKLSPNQSLIVNVANAFLKINKVDYAIETYKKGQKLLMGTYPFYFEIAPLYAQKGEYKKMVNTYLDALLINNGYIQDVQNALDTYLAPIRNDNNFNIIRDELIKRIQKYPSETVYNELLIWFFIQKKDFKNAFIQSKALDKRFNEDGKRILSLANIAFSNEYYDDAIMCYEYIIKNKGINSYYYNIAKMRLVEAYKQKITENYNYTHDDLVKLKNLYENTINELGKNRITIKLIKDYAHFLAFYLYNTKESIKLLKEALEISNANAKDLAYCKIELADIYLMDGNIWDASLLYMQVEKEFKYNPIGDLAKFKNAKISFYTGDFFWAKAQLDVLKASTSKLIANDAMYLSLLIQDNIEDSIGQALSIYARANLYFFQNKFNAALHTLDSLETLFPYNSLIDDDFWLKFKISFKKKNIDTSIYFLNQIITQFPKSVLSDDAMFELAQIYEKYYKDNDKAKQYYEKLIFSHPDSFFVAEARKRLQILLGEEIN